MNVYTSAKVAEITTCVKRIINNCQSKAELEGDSIEVV